MALYEVHSLDVWGNAVDGYEINNRFREGEVVLPPYQGELHGDFVKRLIAAGYLGKEAWEMAQAGELGIEDDFEMITVTEPEEAWVAVQNADVEGPAQEDRYLDANDREEAEEQIDPETERTEQVVGERPVLQLALISGRPDTVPFFRMPIDVGTKTSRHPDPPKAVLEFRIDMAKMVDERVAKPDFKIDSYVDGDFFGTFLLRHIDGEVLGVSRGGHEVTGNEDLISLASVAMDAFLDRGGIGPDTFVVPKEKLLSPEAKHLLERLREAEHEHERKLISEEEYMERTRQIWMRANEQGIGSDIAEAMSR